MFHMRGPMVCAFLLVLLSLWLCHCDWQARWRDEETCQVPLKHSWTEREKVSLCSSHSRPSGSERERGRGREADKYKDKAGEREREMHWLGEARTRGGWLVRSHAPWGGWNVVRVAHRQVTRVHMMMTRLARVRLLLLQWLVMLLLLLLLLLLVVMLMMLVMMMMTSWRWRRIRHQVHRISGGSSSGGGGGSWSTCRRWTGRAFSLHLLFQVNFRMSLFFIWSSKLTST